MEDYLHVAASLRRLKRRHTLGHVVNHPITYDDASNIIDEEKPDEARAFKDESGLTTSIAPWARNLGRALGKLSVSRAPFCWGNMYMPFKTPLDRGASPGHADHHVLRLGAWEWDFSNGPIPLTALEQPEGASYPSVTILNAEFQQIVIEPSPPHWHHSLKPAVTIAAPIFELETFEHCTIGFNSDDKPKASFEMPDYTLLALDKYFQQPVRAIPHRTHVCHPNSLVQLSPPRTPARTDTFNAEEEEVIGMLVLPMPAQDADARSMVLRWSPFGDLSGTCDHAHLLGSDAKHSRRISGSMINWVAFYTDGYYFLSGYTPQVMLSYLIVAPKPTPATTRSVLTTIRTHVHEGLEAHTSVGLVLPHTYAFCQTYSCMLTTDDNAIVTELLSDGTLDVAIQPVLYEYKRVDDRDSHSAPVFTNTVYAFDKHTLRNPLADHSTVASWGDNTAFVLSTTFRHAINGFVFMSLHSSFRYAVGHNRHVHEVDDLPGLSCLMKERVRGSDETGQQYETVARMSGVSLLVRKATKELARTD